MKYADIFEKINNNSEMDCNSMAGMLDAIAQIYPLIVLANLTKNTFVMLKHENFLYQDLANTGDYDAMIEEGAMNIHPSYQRMFIDTFSRENLIRMFSQGQKEIEAKIYQKNAEGNFIWARIKVIQVEDESGDVVHISFNKVLGD